MLAISHNELKHNPTGILLFQSVDIFLKFSVIIRSMYNAFQTQNAESAYFTHH